MKLLIIDHRYGSRESLAAAIASAGDLELVGAAADPEDALQTLARTRPDVAVVDLWLERASGLEVVREGRKAAPSCRYVARLAGGHVREVRQALELGVEGCILHDAPAEELLTAIRAVGQGRRHMQADLVAALLGNPEPELLHRLTAREREVLVAVGQGLSNREIAQTLVIAEYTVKKHVSQILAKLGLSDRTQLALFVCQHGLLD